MAVALWIVFGSVAGILFGLFAGFFNRQAERTLQFMLFILLAGADGLLAFLAPTNEWPLFAGALAAWMAFLAIGLFIGAKLRDINDFQEAMDR